MPRVPPSKAGWCANSLSSCPEGPGLLILRKTSLMTKPIWGSLGERQAQEVWHLLNLRIPGGRKAQGRRDNPVSLNLSFQQQIAQEEQASFEIPACNRPKMLRNLSAASGLGVPAQLWQRGSGRCRDSHPQTHHKSSKPLRIGSAAQHL